MLNMFCENETGKFCSFCYILYKDIIRNLEVVRETIFCTRKNTIMPFSPFQENLLNSFLLQAARSFQVLTMDSLYIHYKYSILIPQNIFLRILPEYLNILADTAHSPL